MTLFECHLHLSFVIYICAVRMPWAFVYSFVIACPMLHCHLGIETNETIFYIRTHTAVHYYFILCPIHDTTCIAHIQVSIPSHWASFYWILFIIFRYGFYSPFCFICFNDSFHKPHEFQLSDISFRFSLLRALRQEPTNDFCVKAAAVGKQDPKYCTKCESIGQRHNTLWHRVGRTIFELIKLTWPTRQHFTWMVLLFGVSSLEQ